MYHPKTQQSLDTFNNVSRKIHNKGKQSQKELTINIYKFQITQIKKQGYSITL